MDTAPLIGLGGDFLTICGGFVLAWDAMTKEREFIQIRNVNKTRESKQMGGLRIEINGVTLTDKEDVARAFIRHSAKQAVWGCRLLAAGFILLFLARLFELRK